MKNFKFDINFLEKPLWQVNKDNDSHKLSVTNKKENEVYIVSGADGLTTHFDATVLYALLGTLYEKDSYKSLEITMTRYELSQDIFDYESIGSKQYELIMNSLQKWKGIVLKFNGIFYNEKNFTTRIFGIIESIILDHHTKKLTVRFNKDFITHMEKSKFYTIFKFKEFKKLKLPTAARLYEIMCRSFLKNRSIGVPLDDFAQIMTLKKRKGAVSYFPSDVVPQLKKAAREVSLKTDIKMSFEFEKDDRICKFKSKAPSNPTISKKLLSSIQDSNRVINNV